MNGSNLSRPSFASVLASGFASAFLVASAASALPVGLAVDAASSTVTLGASSPFPATAQPLAPSGAGSGEVVLANHIRHGEYIASIESGGIDLLLGGATLELDTPAGIDITLEAAGLGGTLIIPELIALAVAPGRSLFDLAGSTLRLDAGSFEGTGSQFGDPFFFTWDLALDPLVLLFPANSVGTAEITSQGGEPFAARFDLPLNLQASFFVGPTATQFTLDLLGTAVVETSSLPEPNTGLLLALGLAVLARVGAREPGR
jgi:hypothetical protein